MVPAYVHLRPAALLCLVVAGMVFTLGAGVAYDSLFFSEGASNKLVFAPDAGSDLLAGDEYVATFGNATHPTNPYMRWLRVSLIAYVKLPDECVEVAYTPDALVPRACLEGVPRSVLVSASVSARDLDTEDWTELGRSTRDAQRVECIDDGKAASTHPGWPADGVDPLSLGRRAHCYVLSLAYKDGLQHAQYLARVSVAPAADDPPLSAWAEQLVVVQTNGTTAHGYAELGLRLVALLSSVVTFALYARAMHQHALHEWLPQQLGVYVFCCAICGYNNPASIALIPLGMSYGVSAAVFDIGFYAAGMLLATVLADPVRESIRSLRADYWAPRLLLTVPMFFLNTAQYALSARQMRADPSFMYELSGSFVTIGALEVVLFSLWSLYVVVLLTLQLRSHEARMRTNKQELAFAAVTALVVGAIWLRESITFKVYTRDFMSDAKFVYRARTVIMTNVFARLVALCYAPSKMSEALSASGGGIDRLFRALLSRGEGAAEAARSVNGALGVDPHTVADALRRYVDALRRAHHDGLDALTAEQREGHERLKASLLALPQTRAYAKQMAWVYPTLGFQSRQPYLWAIVLHDLANNPAGIEPGDTPGIVAAKEMLHELMSKTGLRASLHRAPLGAASDGHALVVLIADCDAVHAEFVREYGARLLVEATLSQELPPATPADRVSAVARLLTAHFGAEHRMLGAVSWRVDGCEVVRASFPLHDRGFNRQVDREWGLAPEISEAHLRVIRDHYGEELAWYFGLSDFTVEWLFPVAAFGFVLELVKLGGDVVFYEMLWVAFGSVLVVWGAFFVAFWRRRSAELRWDWNVDSLLTSIRRNPRFTGEWVTDQETGAPRPAVSMWQRLPAFGNTAFQMLLQVLLLCFIEYISYGQFVWACEQFDAPENRYMFLFQTVIVNTFIYVGLIMFGQYVLWSKVAAWCTRRENWPYETQYDTQYVYYIFIFIWLDGYFWSWFFGYVHVPLVDVGVDLRTWAFPIFGKLFTHERTADYWMKKHDSMVASMLGMNQIAAFLFENVWPLALVQLVRWRTAARRAATVAQPADRAAADATVASSRAREAPRKLTFAQQQLLAVQTIVPLAAAPREAIDVTDAEARETTIQALDELGLPEYSTQDDYYDVVLFIGYIITYTIQWPLTPVVCYLNNNLELRSDLIKVNNAFRRMVPKKQNSIGAWEQCIVFSAWAAIPMVVTFATISSRTAEIFFLASEDPEDPNHAFYWNEDGHVRWWWRILASFLWEHALVLTCLMIHIIVPRQPLWVRRAQAAARFHLAKEAHGATVERYSGAASNRAEVPHGAHGEGDSSERKRGRIVSMTHWLAAHRRKPRVRVAKMA